MRSLDDEGCLMELTKCFASTRFYRVVTSKYRQMNRPAASHRLPHDSCDAIGSIPSVICFFRNCWLSVFLEVKLQPVRFFCSGFYAPVLFEKQNQEYTI